MTDLVIADAKFILVGMFDRFRFETSLNIVVYIFRFGVYNAKSLDLIPAVSDADDDDDL